ncbi:uncharacterized protein LOC142342420 [Convolutriloba macropyga]|uniref:uncharacterized protein LOC142342420 n=1 Tax=Convolutriloba macropyga TaxID=536237 RepID=UPI003F51B432
MATRPEDLNLPATVVTKLVKDSLPAHVNVSKEARVAIGRAASIFVLYTTANANNVAASEKRKTITPEDILSAMRDMEMDQFVNPLRKCLDAYRKCSTTKPKTGAKPPTAPKGGGVTKKPSPKKPSASKTAPSNTVDTDSKALNVKNVNAAETSAVSRDNITSQVTSSNSLRAQEDSDLETSSSASSSEVEPVKRPDAKHGFTNIQSTGTSSLTTPGAKVVVAEDALVLENTDEDSDDSSD